MQFGCLVPLYDWLHESTFVERLRTLALQEGAPHGLQIVSNTQRKHVKILLANLEVNVSRVERKRVVQDVAEGAVAGRQITCGVIPARLGRYTLLDLKIQYFLFLYATSTHKGWLLVKRGVASSRSNIFLCHSFRAATEQCATKAN
jgi:hypothetical protein